MNTNTTVKQAKKGKPRKVKKNRFLVLKTIVHYIVNLLRRNTETYRFTRKAIKGLVHNSIPVRVFMTKIILNFIHKTISNIIFALAMCQLFSFETKYAYIYVCVMIIVYFSAITRSVIDEALR